MIGFVLGLIVAMVVLGLLVHYWRQVLAFMVVFVVGLVLTTIYFAVHSITSYA